MRPHACKACARRSVAVSGPVAGMSRWNRSLAYGARDDDLASPMAASTSQRYFCVDADAVPLLSVAATMGTSVAMCWSSWSGGISSHTPARARAPRVRTDSSGSCMSEPMSGMSCSWLSRISGCRFAAKCISACAAAALTMAFASPSIALTRSSSASACRRMTPLQPPETAAASSKAPFRACGSASCWIAPSFAWTYGTTRFDATASPMEVSSRPPKTLVGRGSSEPSGSSSASRPPSKS
mmetsp:Transcript_39338/g.121655  ORF Transcript_39338/g.121655 Transcript_39338/m.121655 type:complete len:240 (-) Transcript_39338:428-1147(-)